ncbi:hypothetical protein PEC18_29915 [Paucibacter sp. O1-1]|nr:hypothetical protein [Paucibacter sp. O1-1]MDA3829944.1 hypothetical protein [Paucibacter sp. O1-1]
MALQSLTDKTTVPSPANSLMVYNTNASLKYGIGYYFNANTPVSPDWRFLSSVAMPYYYGGNEINAIFQIDNYNGNNQNATAIKGYSTGTGVGVHAKSEFGNALIVEGRMKLFGSDTNPGTGKVLTSDAFGEAKWEGAVAFSMRGVESGMEMVAKDINYKIPFKSSFYDLDNNYTNATSEFVAPVDGLYHFDVQVCWGGAAFTTDLQLIRERNGTSNTLVINSNTNNGSYFTSVISADMDLKQGDIIYVTITHHRELQCF